MPNLRNNLNKAEQKTNHWSDWKSFNSQVILERNLKFHFTFGIKYNISVFCLVSVINKMVQCVQFNLQTNIKLNICVCVGKKIYNFMVLLTA